MFPVENLAGTQFSDALITQIVNWNSIFSEIAAVTNFEFNHIFERDTSDALFIGEDSF